NCRSKETSSRSQPPAERAIRASNSMNSPKKPNPLARAERISSSSRPKAPHRLSKNSSAQKTSKNLPKLAAQTQATTSVPSPPKNKSKAPKPPRLLPASSACNSAKRSASSTKPNGNSFGSPVSRSSNGARPTKPGSAHSIRSPESLTKISKS